jgi:hypothetical protein
MEWFDLTGRENRLKEVHEEIVPFVRDYYVVALRTLLDRVLFNAGWSGSTGRSGIKPAGGGR